MGYIVKIVFSLILLGVIASLLLLLLIYFDDWVCVQLGLPILESVKVSITDCTFGHDKFASVPQFYWPYFTSWILYSHADQCGDVHWLSMRGHMTSGSKTSYSLFHG